MGPSVTQRYLLHGGCVFISPWQLPTLPRLWIFKWHWSLWTPGPWGHGGGWRWFSQGMRAGIITLQEELLVEESWLTLSPLLSSKGSAQDVRACVSFPGWP